MATLTVWKFPDADGADAAVDTLRSLEKQQLINLLDGATVAWAPTAKRPKTRQAAQPHRLRRHGWDVLGDAAGDDLPRPAARDGDRCRHRSRRRRVADVGIDDDFIKRVREEVTPGTSALFAMTSGAVLDKVHDAFAGSGAELIHTNLSADQEHELREVFA